jgi:hypothetical protein
MVEVVWLVPLTRFRTLTLLVRLVDYKVDKYRNLRLGEETKGLQVGYHRMGRLGRG